jgi:predicted transcriptional regulator
MPKGSPLVLRPKWMELAPLKVWQITRIEAGLADAKVGRLVSTDALFAAIADIHGWSRTP